ncbi:hypothetical protein DVV95_11145 [Clostridium botulinum]|uniref:hypothetical protein n=1 Tax=Clostridium botulinum TaxID=1491 RepID=UPI000A177C48|nr:hypothetical protein [Clostridium botulinum]MBN1062369.1 hypothetical protein [Clostridium botulinum]
MYNKDDLLTDLKKAGISNRVSHDYGCGTVIELDLQPKYMFYVAQSNISPCFFNATKNVIDALVSDNKDFALVLMDTQNNQLYIYDVKQALNLLSHVSYEKTYNNYRINKKDLFNPIDYETFYEFLTTL